MDALLPPQLCAASAHECFVVDPEGHVKAVMPGDLFSQVEANGPGLPSARNSQLPGTAKDGRLRDIGRS